MAKFTKYSLVYKNEGYQINLHYRFLTGFGGVDILNSNLEHGNEHAIPVQYREKKNGYMNLKCK